MSFAMTTAAVIERRKTVTRRRGWLWLTPTTRLLAVDKIRQANWNPLACIEIVSSRLEPLNWITAEDLAREGFAADHFFGAYGPAGYHYGVTGFVNMFAAKTKISATDEVNRIEFKYLDCYACGAPPSWVDELGRAGALEPVCDAHRIFDRADGRCWPLARAEAQP